MDQGLLDLLRAYRPSEKGPCFIGDELALVLPVPQAFQFPIVDMGTASFSAGQTDPELVYTVPQDRRAWLGGLFASRASGDNLLRVIEVRYPAGHGTAQNLRLIRLTTEAVNVFWPDVGGRQAVTFCISVAPLLLEPGTLVYLTPNGDGVSASTAAYEMVMYQSKLIPNLPPN